MSKQTDYELFLSRFKPEMDSGNNSIRFYETTGADLDHIKTLYPIEHRRIWTYVDGGDYSCFSPGVRWINRMAYIVCSVPYQDGHEHTRNYDY